MKSPKFKEQKQEEKTMSLKVGLQLYSVRDEMEKDIDKTFKAVK